MKSEAKKILIKDIVIAAAAWVVASIIISLMMEGFSIGVIVLGLFFAGLPFGWRWMSSVIIATRFTTVLIKGALAVVLGWIAIFIVIIGDVIRFVRAEEDA